MCVMRNVWIMNCDDEFALKLTVFALNVYYNTCQFRIVNSRMHISNWFCVDAGSHPFCTFNYTFIFTLFPTVSIQFQCAYMFCGVSQKYVEMEMNYCVKLVGNSIPKCILNIADMLWTSCCYASSNRKLKSKCTTKHRIQRNSSPRRLP